MRYGAWPKMKRTDLAYLVVVLVLAIDATCSADKLHNIRRVRRKRLTPEELLLLADRYKSGGNRTDRVPFLSNASSSSFSNDGRRDPRLFSNPFGILGHDVCQTNAGANYKDAGGVCYNEMECLLKGGMFSNYCGPPAVTGVCCVFVANRCDAKITEKVSYYTNPSYPGSDKHPMACVVKIEPKSDVCWVRFDFLDFDLHAGPDGRCEMDSLTIVNSPDGAGGRFCGSKSGYSTITSTSQEGIYLSMVIQSPAHKWQIKVTQIKCDAKQPVPVFNQCGITGATGFVRRMLNDNEVGEQNNEDDDVDIEEEILSVRRVRKKKRKKKFKKRPKKHVRSDVGHYGVSSVEERFCRGDDEFSAACQLVSAAASGEARLEAERAPRLQTSDELTEDIFLAEERMATSRHFSSQVLQKKRLETETYYPAFNSRDVFCRSKFRQGGDDFDRPSFKIIDGTEAPVNAFPWIISLQYRGNHFCGGSLLTHEYVVTAAHCMDFGNVKNFMQNLVVKLGDHDITRFNDTDSIARGVSNIMVHPRWFNNPSGPGDVAILKLDKPVNYTTKIAPVCLPTNPEETFARMLGVAAGWGITETGDISDVLRQVELNIIPNITCVENLNTLNLYVTDDQICTFKGPIGTESTCSGDSGGPLMIRRGGRFVLVGITSFSVSDCSAPFPSGFARVTNFLDWFEIAMST